MARRSYTADEKEQALALYVEQGPSRASAETGIPAATIASWASRNGVATIRREKNEASVAAMRLDLEGRKTALAEAFVEIAELAVARQRELIRSSNLRDVVGAGTRAIHDTLLLTGQATSRSEVISTDALTAEIQRLEAELGAS